MNADAAADPDLSDDERAELERLRRELAERKLAEREQAESHAGRGGRAARGGRWAGAVVLLLLSALVGILSTVAVYARGELLDTNRYVATVAPLARDPVMQDAITARLTTEIVTRLDLPALARQLVDALVQRGAPPAIEGLVGPLVDGIESALSKEIHTVVTSDQFAQAWDTANRVAHDELDALLTTGQGEFLSTEGTEVSIDLGPFLAIVKTKLVEKGLTLVEKVPNVSIKFPLFHSDALPKLRNAVSLLNKAAWVLPILALLLLGAGIAVAPNRRRGLLIGSALFGVGMLLLLGTLAIARTYYLDRLPDAVQSPAAAQTMYDTVLRFLVQAAKTLAVLAGIVFLACWLAGPGRFAGLVRRGGNRVLDAAGHGITRAGLPLGPVPGFARTHRRAIQVAVVVVALAVLVIWRHPGVSGTLWLTAGVLVVLGVVEVVARVTEAAPTPGHVRAAPG